MTPVTVLKNTSLQVAATIMLDNNISSLSVVPLEDEVEGIVTRKDILGYFVKDNEK